jgi:hypothetical protein
MVQEFNEVIDRFFDRSGTGWWSEYLNTALWKANVFIKFAFNDEEFNLNAI